jgi:type I restriction enzyme, R subunit
MLRYATDAGWEYVSPEEALTLRHGETGALFWPVLLERLPFLNPTVLDSVAAENAARSIARVRPTIEGNQDAWRYLLGLKTVFVETERRERNLRVLDGEDISANVFQVTDEFSFTNGKFTVRLDIVFLVNGIPVLFAELKSPSLMGGIEQAFKQVTRYHREGPELMALAQLDALTQLSRFYYGATWNLSAKSLFNWKDESAGDFEVLVKTFIRPKHVIRVIRDFILFTRQDDELRKVVLRPHQMRAVESVVRRAAEPEKRRGLVWHTQGSGKTYTMISAAKKLIDEPALENPTVLMLVDRNELEAQLFSNLEAVGFGHVEVAQSKRHLRALLSENRRGLIVSTIHKFDNVPANVNEQSNVFVLVDEAHRTTGGDLGNYLMGALPNATYIGFTGTPIDRSAHGKGTFKVFSVDDPERRYLDKYSIRESIDDGTTVPLHYALAPNELRVDRDVLQREFLSLAELEGVSDVEDLNRVLEKAVTLKNMLKSEERMAKVASYVAEHFREAVEPMGYKAFLVAVDREACARYKRLLDQHLPKDYSTVVISRGFNDSEELAACHLSEDEEQRVRKAFRRRDDLPKLLLVTEKLLTGFDAPVLYCMYLDKPMRDHVLLQAIARVNRPYEDAEGLPKPSGFVLDFVGIFENLESALAFDSQDVAGVLQNVDVLRRHFEQMMERGRDEYLPISGGGTDDKAVEAVLRHFRDREVRETFYAYFRQLQDVYEILSPDPFLRAFIQGFGDLAAMYRMLRASYDAGEPVEHGFLHKTEALVQDLTRSGNVMDPEHVYSLGPEALEVIASQREMPEAVKVFNLVKVLYALVKEKAGEQTYLIDVGERAQQIVLAFEERQLTTQQALEQLQTELSRALKAQDEQQTSDLSPDAFAVLWLLRGRRLEKVEEIALAMNRAFEKHPHWRQSEQQDRDVRRALYKALMGAEVKDVTQVAEWLLTVLGKRS